MNTYVGVKVKLHTNGFFCCSYVRLVYTVGSKQRMAMVELIYDMLLVPIFAAPSPTPPPKK